MQSMAQINRKRSRREDSTGDCGSSPDADRERTLFERHSNLAFESRESSTSSRTRRLMPQPDIDSDADRLFPGPPQERKIPGHEYHSMHARGNASVHQGDNHYYNSTGPTSLLGRLLTSLNFPQRRSRYDDVEEKYGQTFDWVLQPRSDQQPAWDSFHDWLYGVEKTYWVSGKPGSGKSTLIKYLYTTTARLLDPLHFKRRVISFWFWEAAHEKLERTLKGCLRSMLWQVLQYPDTNAEIADALQKCDGYEWTKSGLQKAFNTTLNILDSKGISTFIFLDGLDESGLDRESLVDFVINTNRDFPRVKFCVSSRHEPLFEARLALFPKLRMQDLNGPDIDIIIEKDLLKSPEYITLCKSDRQINDLGIRDILREKAQGVILWVLLVVRDLLRGIRNWDTAQQLEERIDRMPAELDKLYDMMLKRNSPGSEDYRTDAAFYCRLIEHRKFDLIAFSLAINDDVRAAYLSVQKNWEVLHHRLQCERAKVWVNARTGCLLEIRDRHGSRFRLPYECSERSRCEPLKDFLDNYSGQHVDFIHRTARTYLFDSSAGQELLAASTRTATEIERICFETSIVRGTVLRAFESAAPVGLDIITLNEPLRCQGRECGCSLEVAKTNRVTVETALDNLQREGLLWTEMHPTDSLHKEFSIDSCFVALPVIRTGRIDYCRLYAHMNMWTLVYEYLISQQEPSDEGMTTLMPLLAPLLITIDTNHDPIVEAILRLERITNSNQTVSTEFQEEISIYHEIMWKISPHFAGRYVLRQDLVHWLGNAQSSTSLRAITPTMRACNSLFFKGTNESKLSARTNFIGSHRVRYLPRDLNSSVHGDSTLLRYIRENLRRTPSGPCVIVEWPRFGQRPKIYGLSEDESAILLHTTSGSGWVQHGIGVLDGDHKFLSLGAFKHTELPSLYAALLHINKPKESILAFAAEEEKRLALQLTNAYFQQWKAWFWGEDLQNPDGT